MWKLLIPASIIVLVSFGYFARAPNIESSITLHEPSPFPIPSSTPLPISYSLKPGLHVFQTFNNCGPAALSMALSHLSINASQQEIGNILRPYQNQEGDNDDKSVTLAELAQHAEAYGLVAYYRPAGDIELLKQLLVLDVPIITRTLTKPTEDIGHYRVITGFDDVTEVIIQDDSLQGKNLRFSYQDFSPLWEVFNNEYLVIAPPDKKQKVESALGSNLDPKTAWENALKAATNDLGRSVAAYHLGQYAESVKYYESAEPKLPLRALWYQIEPIQAYAALGQYDKVDRLIDQIITRGNRAASELYEIRGQIYQKQGKTTEAQTQFQLVQLYRTKI